jgi:hypothetical protein
VTHPGQSFTVLAAPEAVPPGGVPFAVALTGRLAGAGRRLLAFTVQARTRAAAEVKADLLARRLMPRSQGWRAVRRAVSGPHPVDPRRVMIGEDVP